MRLTLPWPAGPTGTLDVEVEPGLPAAALRRRLALLTGDARWARASTLEVAGRTLGDEHPAGVPPLVPGAHVGPGPDPAQDAHEAARADVHVAVLAGPATGRLVTPPARVVVTCPGAREVRVDVRRSGRRVTVRVHGARGALRGRRPTRRVGRVPRRWPPGAALDVAGTLLELRTAVPARARGPAPVWVGGAVASVAGAVLLATVLRQPLLLLTALTGVVGLLAVRRPGTGTSGPGVAPGAGAHGGAADSRAAGGGRADGGRAAAGTADGGPADVAALRVRTARTLHARDGHVPGADAPWPADRTLALTGPRPRTLAAARALALRTLGAGTRRSLVLRTARPGDWRWARWWEPTSELPGPDADALVIVDGHDPQVVTWRLGAPDVHVLVVVPPGGAPPAWASTVLAADTDTGPEAVGDDVAEAQARTAAALAWARSRADGPVPRTAPPAVLGALAGIPGPSAGALAAAWDREPTTPDALVLPLGTGPDGGTVAVDLVRDGPHVLVGGTTGAGKSELLTTLVLAAALRHAPRRLAVLLVDFKGGTGLGPLAGLPHVVDHVHDLDVTAARRTLVQLRAELHRRERVLRASGATDVADLAPDDPARPARLLVVVDELRALVDDLPDAAAVLARLAAQGRALGVHLVLATQRPAGAVPPDLRANLSLRVALRVADEDDSRDVVGTPAAAHLDPGTPGAALLRVGARPPVALRVARARCGRSAPPVRLVPGAPAAGCAWAAPPPSAPDVAAWVAACRDAARDRAGTRVPWVPALPERLPPDAGPADPAAPLVAVADVPHEQRRADVRWRTDRGALLVLGGPRSGRTTTLTTVGTQVLRGGGHVHAVGLPARAVARLAGLPGRGLGTTVGVDDTHRTLLLLHRLARDPAPCAVPTVLLVDGLDVLLDVLVAPARGRGLELLEGLLRHPRPGLHLAASGAAVPAVTRLAAACGTRVVLGLPDVTLDAPAGVPAALAGPRTTPGRAVACTADDAVLCQVLPPCDADAPAAAAAVPALRLGPLPVLSTAPPDPGEGTHLPLGTGGDGPGPVGVDPARPLVVAGPPGSGRSSVLRTLADAWAARGAAVLLVTGVPVAGPRGAARPGTSCVAPYDALGAVLDARGPDGRGARPVALTGPDAPPVDGPGGCAVDARSRRAARDVGVAPVVVLVDDADDLERADPLLADRLAHAVRHPSSRVRVGAVATTTEHAAVAHRGPVAAALRARQVLVLDPHGAAATDLLGPDAPLHADPARRPPGRGVLRDGWSLVRVQVHAPADAARPGTGGAARPA